MIRLMRYGIRTLLTVFLLCCAPVTVQAAPAQVMNYELYVGGINAATAQLDLILASNRYDIRLFAETKGLLGKIVPWAGTFDTKGQEKGVGFLPSLHSSRALTKNKDEVKTYKYGSSGAFLNYSQVENGKDRTPKKLDPALTQNTIDALTATLSLMQNVAARGECTGESEVFDGKRRFKMIFRDEGEDTLTANKYNIYAGPARRCSLEVVPQGGKWSDQPRGWMSIQEQGLEKGALPTFWLAQIEKNKPATLVKSQIKTDYGVFFAHLIRYRHGENDVKASVLKN